MRLGTLFALVACLIVAYCASVKWESLSRRSEQPNTWPVSFISENEFLAQSKTQLIRWRVGELGPHEVVFNVPKDADGELNFASSGCFSNDRWILRTELRTKETTKSGPSFFAHVADRYFVDPNAVERVKFLPGIHRVDCVRAEGKNDLKKSIRNPKGEAPDIQARLQPTLFSSEHAQNVFTAADFGILVIEYERDGESFRHTLEGGWHRDYSRPAVTHEADSSVYWLQKRGRQSGPGEPESWPQFIWRFDVGSNEIEQFELPSGPWVDNYEDRWACFSCGCGCYRKLKFVPARDTLFAYVSGIGFPAKAQGIYALSYRDEKPEWRTIFSGPVATKPIVSSSGCKLIFSAPEIKQLNLCQ